MEQSLQKKGIIEPQNRCFHHKMKKKTVLILLFSIFVLGCVLRFYGLSIQSLWTDELASWYISSKKELGDVIEYTAQHDTYPPGYYIFLHLVIKYVGDSETILRFPSACAGALSILIIYLMGVQLYTHREGLIAAALMAFLWCPIYYSQEARAYSFLILFTLMATYFWISMLKEITANRKPRKITALCYILFSTISCYLHYFGLYLIALQGLGSALLFLNIEKARFYIITIYSSIAIAFSPWLPHLWQQLHEKYVVSRDVSPMLFIKFLGYIFNASKPRSLPLRDYSNVDIAISTAIIVFILFSLVTVLIKVPASIMKKTYRNIREIILVPDVILLLWLTIPFLGILILSISSIKIYGYTYLLISLPPAYLLFSRSITQFPISFKSKKVLTISLIVLATFQLLFHNLYYTQPHKYQYREAFDYIFANQWIHQDAKMIVYAWDDTVDYYSKRSSYEAVRKIIVNPRSEPEQNLCEITSPSTNYIWLISADIIPNDKFIAFFNNNYKLISSKEFFGAKVWLFKRRLSF